MRVVEFLASAPQVLILDLPLFLTQRQDLRRLLLPERLDTLLEIDDRGMQVRVHQLLLGQPRLHRLEPLLAELLEVLDGAPLAIEHGAKLRQLLALGRFGAGPPAHDRGGFARLLRVALPRRFARLLHLLGSGVDLLVQPQGVALEDGQRLGDRGDLGGVPRFEEVLLRGLDQAIGHLAVGPLDGDLHGAFADLHGEAAVEQAHHGDELVLRGGWPAEKVRDEILEPQDRGARTGPLCDEVRLLDQRDEVVVTEHGLGRGAQRRVGLPRHAARRISQRGDDEVALREDLGLGVVSARQHREREQRSPDHEGDDARDEQLAAAERGQHEGRVVPHLLVVDQVEIFFFRLRPVGSWRVHRGPSEESDVQVSDGEYIEHIERQIIHQRLLESARGALLARRDRRQGNDRDQDREEEELGHQSRSRPAIEMDA